MNKISQISEVINNALIAGCANYVLNEIIEAALKNSFDEGMKHNEVLFNPNTQSFERFTPDFNAYVNEPFEYPGFTY